MEFLAGTLFGVGVTGFFGCLILTGAMGYASNRITAMEVAVNRLADKKARDDGDWWKDGISFNGEDD
jgi:hypothetical protein